MFIMDGQKFFIYARKSTDVEDMQVRSIGDQLSVLREYASRENILVVEELVEKQSAKIPGRPIFDQMLLRMEQGEASGILSWHPDRLARNGVDGGKITYLLDTGVIKSLKFPQFWFEPTAQGKFMLSLAFSQSKYYVDSLSENTKRGLHQKARGGDYPGVPPLGYINDVRTKTIVVSHHEAKVVKDLFTTFARGTYKIKDMQTFLWQKGIKTRNGKPYSLTQTSNILRNQFYLGLFKYCGETYQGKHEPLIPKKLFDQVQEVLNQKSNHSWQKPKVLKAYTGLFRCGECGMMVTGEYHLKHYKGTGRTVPYTYYRCTKKSKIKKCFQTFVREEELDKQLSEMVKKFSLSATQKTQLLTLLEEDKRNVTQSTQALVQGKKEEIRLLNQKLQFLLDAFLDQTLERGDYLPQKEKLILQKKNLDEEIAGLEQAPNSWLEPLGNWIERASEVAKIANSHDFVAKKVLAKEIYGSNLILENRLARGKSLGAWAALRAAPTIRDLVP